MAERTCSIPGCERRHYGRGWCKMHHLRWLRTGDAGPAEMLNHPAPPECIVPGCHGRPRVRGLCAMHYWRKKQHGDPGSAEKRRKPSPPICIFEGCDRKPKAHGLCHMHYIRQRKHGDPALGAMPDPDGISYFAVHEKLRRRYGSASEQPCRMCGGPAYDWAYDHGDPDERRDEDCGLIFSLDLARYLPVCRPCHRKLDAA